MKTEKKQSKETNLAKSIFLHFVLFFLATLIIVTVGILIILSIKSIPIKILFALLFLLVNSVVLAFVIHRIKNKVKDRIDIFVNNNAEYESILDAVPFPIHVTDNDMKWTYMNKAFENLLIQNGVIKDRKSAYGLLCSTAGANICNTESCGIRQLREKNKAETYFDWYGSKCKQDTAVIKDQFGNDAGYVEVVTDLTSILKVNEYAKNEIGRLSASLNMIANGNLDVDLEETQADQYTQEMMEMFSKINDSLKKVKDSIHILDEEAVKLAEAGRNGELDVRGDESRLKGVFAQIIHGVNQTFDSIKEPLDVASGFISTLAEGGNQDDIDNTYSGYYASLVDDLNHAKHSLRVLADESVKLRDAGLEGNLSVRGDTGKLKGGYADIIDGFNKMLDSIITPLDESGVVMGKMALNDYTSKMSDGYKGRMKEFADSVNSVHGRLLSIQDVFQKISRGDTSMLEHFKSMGARSEADHQIPAMIATMQAIRDLIDQANVLASATLSGDLSVRGDAEKFEGGYRQIIEGMNKTMEAVAAPINESVEVLQELAGGDLTAEMIGDYKGEYNTIKVSLNQAISSFNELLGEIAVAASQVSAGSSQVSDASQSLSQGATEQASSIEELTSSVAEIAAQTKQNASSATQASEISMAMKSEAAQGNDKMAQMLDSMKEINESSANISKIIKVIDSIAFQTNILALNAAVEAARAGQYGKGFAVVAEEVRNLAAKSAEAAKDTTAMIENSISKVQTGTTIANETADMLGKIVQSAQKSALLVSNIAAASNEQATAIAQIDQGVAQVSTVVQTNSATAEESAASSEELSGQANMLTEMVGKFKLKKGSAGFSGNVNETRNKKTEKNKSVSPRITLEQGFGKY